MYKNRRDVLIESMKRVGWDIPKPEATMFAWAPIPQKYLSKGSIYFSKVLLKKHHWLYHLELDLDLMVINMLELA